MSGKISIHFLQEHSETNTQHYSMLLGNTLEKEYGCARCGNVPEPSTFLRVLVTDNKGRFHWANIREHCFKPFIIQGKRKVPDVKRCLACVSSLAFAVCALHEMDATLMLARRGGGGGEGMVDEYLQHVEVI